MHCDNEASGVQDNTPLFNAYRSKASKAVARSITDCHIGASEQIPQRCLRVCGIHKERKSLVA